MREPFKISEERLRACLQDYYALAPVTLDFLPLGLDTYAGVYRVVSEQGAAFLLKVTSRPLYKPGCLVLDTAHTHEEIVEKALKYIYLKTLPDASCGYQANTGKPRKYDKRCQE